MSMEIQTHLANLPLFSLPVLIEASYCLLYILPQSMVYFFFIVKKQPLKAKVGDCCQAELQ